LNFQDHVFERHYQTFARKQLRRTFDTIRVLLFLAYQSSLMYLGVFYRCPIAAVAPLGALAMEIILLLCLEEEEYIDVRAKFLTSVRLGTSESANPTSILKAYSS
jgi:hypothetical protein